VASASKILALIQAEETKYQLSLNEAYQEMGDKSFKSLRRALPMTRAKLDWERVCTPDCMFCGLRLTSKARFSDINLEQSFRGARLDLAAHRSHQATNVNLAGHSRNTKHGLSCKIMPAFNAGVVFVYLLNVPVFDKDIVCDAVKVIIIGACTHSL
jgi:hypothetical protein